MNRNENIEVTDPVLRAALEDLRDEPLPEVDWDRLRSTINGRAALVLARKRSRRAAFIPRQMVPLALAASVAFALWIGPEIVTERLQAPATEVAVTWDEDDILIQALGDLSEQEFRLLVSGRADPDILLAFAIGAD